MPSKKLISSKSISSSKLLIETVLIFVLLGRKIFQNFTKFLFKFDLFNISVLGRLIFEKRTRTSGIITNDLKDKVSGSVNGTTLATNFELVFSTEIK